MKLFQNLQILQQKEAMVEILLGPPAKLEPLTGSAGLQKVIQGKNIYRPQLALAGYVGLFNYNQVQVFGNTEIFYLNSLSPADRINAFSTICQFPIPCIILTNGHTLEQELLDIAIEKEIPVLATKHNTTKISFLLMEFLDDLFAPQAVVHGSFVDVYGVGLLFAGRSGIGKSEIALDLIERGHRLVADDVVMLTKKRETTIMGTSTSMVQHFMEIRGLGIINIREMFGIRSIRFQKRLETIILLEEWKSSSDYTRTGLDEEPIDLMGVAMSCVKLPIFPGKNITVIAEVIAINYLLRTYGYDAAIVMSDKLTQAISNKSGPKRAFEDRRLISYFQSDNE